MSRNIAKVCIVSSYMSITLHVHGMVCFIQLVISVGEVGMSRHIQAVASSPSSSVSMTRMVRAAKAVRD